MCVCVCVCACAYECAYECVCACDHHWQVCVRYTMLEECLGKEKKVCFKITRSKELLLRWMEMSAFSDAMFRTHVGNRPNASAQVRVRVCVCECVCVSE